MDRTVQDINAIYEKLVRTVRLIHPARVQNNFELAPLPDSVFNSGGDKGKRSFIEDEPEQLFGFSLYCGGCFKEILVQLSKLYFTYWMGTIT